MHPSHWRRVVKLAVAVETYTLVGRPETATGDVTAQKLGQTVGIHAVTEEIITGAGSGRRNHWW